MTNLTEKWINIYKHKNSYWCGAPNHTKSEALLHLADTENYLTTVNIEQLLKLQEENAQLKEYERIVASYYMKPIDYETACETVNKLLDDNKRLKQENAKLKELLKECKERLIYCTISTQEVQAKINQVLGE